MGIDLQMHLHSIGTGRLTPLTRLRVKVDPNGKFQGRVSFPIPDRRRPMPAQRGETAGKRRTPGWARRMPLMLALEIPVQSRAGGRRFRGLGMQRVMWPTNGLANTHQRFKLTVLSDLATLIDQLQTPDHPALRVWHRPACPTHESRQTPYRQKTRVGKTPNCELP